MDRLRIGIGGDGAIAELAGPGDEIVVGNDVYGGTFRYLERVRRGAGVDSIYVDLEAGPDVLWRRRSRSEPGSSGSETPSNPLLKVVDIDEVAATVRRRAAEGGRRRPLIVVDNTFASPALQRPLQHGADIVFHSATKYLAGHSDTVVGVAVTSDPEAAERLRFLQNAMGAVPRAARLLPRPARSADAHLRMERHGATPPRSLHGCATGRTSRTCAIRASAGWSRSSRPRAGSRAAQPRNGRPRSPRAPRLFTLAESLGGVESLIEVPAAMTHMSVAGSPLEVDPALVRLSVGIEGIDDLIADLARALDGPDRPRVCRTRVLDEWA